MVMATGAFSEDLWPGIMGWFGDAYNDYPPLWEKIADVHQSDKAFEKFQEETILVMTMRQQITKGLADTESKRKALESWLSAAREKAEISYK